MILYKKTIIWPWGQRSRSNEGHSPTYQISLTYLKRQKSYGLDKLRWEEAEEAEAEEKIRLKQYVSLRSKGRHNYDSIFRSRLQINNVFYSVSTVNFVLCDLPREQWNMVTYDRRSPNTGLIDMKYIVKGNKN